ncbi:MAG: hypothetical protein AAGI54_15260 [Planctomycetota bacterium]
MPPRRRDPRFFIAVALSLVAVVAIASYVDGWFRDVWLYARPLSDHGVSVIREPGWLMIVHEFGMGSLMQMNPGLQAPPRFAFYYEPATGLATPTLDAFRPTTVDLVILKANLEPARIRPGADAVMLRHELVTAVAVLAAGLAWLSYRRALLKRRAADQRCVHCGYDLRGQGDDKNACPECGGDGPRRASPPAARPHA